MTVRISKECFVNEKSFVLISHSISAIKVLFKKTKLSTYTLDDFASLPSIFSCDFRLLNGGAVPAG